MEQTDVLLTVGLDTRDASKTAEQLQKEVKSIFDSRQGESSAALTSIEIQMKKGYDAAQKLRETIADLTSKQSEIDIFKQTKESFDSTKTQLDEISSKIAELKSKKINFLGEDMTAKEIEDYGKNLQQTIDKNAEFAKRLESSLKNDKTQLLMAQESGDTQRIRMYTESIRAAKEQLQQLAAREEEALSEVDAYNNALVSASKSLKNLTVDYKGQQTNLAQLQKELDETTLKYDDLGSKIRKQQQVTPTIASAEYEKEIQAQLAKRTTELDGVNDRIKQQVIHYREVLDKLNEVDEKDKDINKSTQKINMNWGKVGSTIRRLNTTINSIFKRAAGHFQQINRETSAMSFSFKSLLRNILAYGLGIRGLYAVFSKLRSAVSEGLRNYERYDKQFENSVKDLKASLLTLKNALAGAFVPIIQVAIPYIKQLIQWMINLASYIGQFTAAIVGQEKYAKAVQQTADALDAAGKAAEGYLSPIDTINKMNKDSGIGFEPAAISEDISDLAKRVKDTIAELFAPLKKAWDIFGDYIIRAWKRVVSSIKKLVGDIWRDFKDVWTGSTMQKVFYNITALLGDIGNLVADIIDKIDEAWNANGKRILEAIASLLEVITRHFRRFVEITREWVKNVNLNPLFEKLAELLEHLKPVAEEVFGMLEDFYEKVLLKLAKWTLEEGLPNLLETLKDFVDKVDWEKLRQNLSDLWDHVEPFMERVGEGLILFIQDLSDKVANWVNSESFENLLESIEKFLDGVSAEDVKDGIENVIKFVATIKALTLLTGLAATISKLGELYSTMKQISLLKNLAKTVSVGVEADTAGAAAAGTSLATTFAAAVIAAIAGFEIGKRLGELIFPEDAEYYKNFKWFGENGFFVAVKDWWDLIFIPGLKEWADGLKKDFEDYVDDCVKIFDDGADDLATVVNDGLNLIVSFLNGDFTSAWNNARKLASDCATAIKSAFDNVASVAADIPVIGEVFKTRFTWRGINGTSGGAHHGFATGGVIPPSAEEHLIKVGDNNVETEIVSPLSVIRQAVSEAISAMGGTGSQPIVLKQYLDGKQVAEAVVREGKLQQMSTGRNMFALG